VAQTVSGHAQEDKIQHFIIVGETAIYHGIKEQLHEMFPNATHHHSRPAF